MGFFYAFFGAYNMLQGLYITALGYSESFLGAMLGARTLALATIAIPSAFIVSYIGRKKAIIIAGVFIPIAAIMSAVFVDKNSLLINSIFQGSVHGLLMISEGPYIMANSSEKRRLKMFSFIFSVNVFSSMIGYLVFGVISNYLEITTTALLALKHSIILAGIIGLVCPILFLFVKDSASKIERKIIKFNNIKALLRSEKIVRFLIYNFIIGFGAGLVVPFFNVYLSKRVYATTDQIGVIMALAQISVGSGGLITPFLAKRIGRINTIITCQVISIPFLMMIALPPSLYIVAIALFIRNGFMNMAAPLVNSLTMEIVPVNSREAFSSISTVCSNVSRAISISVAGFIMSNMENGYEIPYFMTAILYIIASIIFYRTFKDYRQELDPA